MYCEFCGSFIPDGQAFCSNCGAKAPVVTKIVATPVDPSLQQAELEQLYKQNDVLQEVKFNRVVNVKARVGLICGIVAITTSMIPLFNVIPAIAGIVFSLLGWSKAKECGGKGNCIAGLSLSGVSILIGTSYMITQFVELMR